MRSARRAREKITKKEELRRLDKENSCAGFSTGRWLWDASRELRDANLNEFWAKWREFSVLTSLTERYELLKHMAHQVYQINPLGKLHNHRMRRRFNVFKQDDLPLDGKVCGCCEAPAEIRHHIIPITNGGHNDKLNLLELCRACHEEIHPWMKHAAEPQPQALAA